MPVPLSATVWGLPPPESTILSVAVRRPVAAGLKVRVTVQVAAAPRVEVQVLDVMLKSFAFVPDLFTPMVTELEPVFVTVTVCAGLVDPTLTLPKFRLAGATVITVPVPDSDAFCVLGPALSFTFKMALRLPDANGVKVTLIVQVAPTATLQIAGCPRRCR
jgi:hypothetical protein